MKKILLSGLLAGVVMIIVALAIGQVLNFIVPSVEKEYHNQNLFRPWSDPLMSLMFVEPFILGIILAWIWSKVKDLIKHEAFWRRGVCFGFVYWVITIPGMIMSYSTFPISLIMTVSWSASIFVQAICAGLIFSKIIK